MTVSNGKLEDYIFALSSDNVPSDTGVKVSIPKGDNTYILHCRVQALEFSWKVPITSFVFHHTDPLVPKAIFPWSCIFSLEMAQLCQITFPNFWFMKIMVDAHFLKNFKLKIVSAVLKFTWHVTCLRCTAWGWASCVYCRTTRVSVNTSLITVSLFVVRIFQVHTQQLWGV